MMLTSFIVRDPLYPGGKISNLEIISIKNTALLQSEVYSLLAIFCVTGFIS